MRGFRIMGFAMGLCGLAAAGWGALVPVVSVTNVNFRMMASNLTGSSQRYEAFATRILQGLRPDVVAIQEFNVGGNSSAELRAFVETAFGPGFSYSREAGYAIPNGVISRFAFIESGSWDDPQVNDRGFAWARIDLPGTNDLIVVSVHLHGSGGATSRAAEALALRQRIQGQFAGESWLVLAGDLNIDHRGETALFTFRTFLVDDPIPTDQAGDPDTNAPRSKPYDVVLTSPTLRSWHVPVSLPGVAAFPNGLVFDSRVFTPLSAVVPVQSADSGLAQHMAVVKDFRYATTLTNWVEVAAPTLEISRAAAGAMVLRWSGPDGVRWTVEVSEDLATWSSVGQITGAGGPCAFTNEVRGAGQFLRVRAP